MVVLSVFGMSYDFSPNACALAGSFFGTKHMDESTILLQTSCSDTVPAVINIVGFHQLYIPH